MKKSKGSWFIFLREDVRISQYKSPLWDVKCIEKVHKGKKKDFEDYEDTPYSSYDNRNRSKKIK